jgi:hypothetical protein
MKLHYDPATSQLDLFGKKPRRARRKRRVLMHVINAGDNEGEPGYAVVVRFQCSRCKEETDWLQVENVTAAKRGMQCRTRGQQRGTPLAPGR